MSVTTRATAVRAGSLLVLTAALGAAYPAVAADPGVRAELELGPSWFSRNDIRIPGDAGTRFDMTDLTGSGPDPFVRAEVVLDIDERHGVRLVLAPLEVSGSGDLPQPTRFDDTDFAAGATRGSYRFSTWKLTYRYTLHEQRRWRWRIGFTGLIRDAEVSLQQGDLAASDANVGFVPLLHLAADYRLSDRWQLSLDFDGLAGGPGRAFDVALEASYRLNRRWRLGAGYRTLEGGVDSDDVYSFGWLHYGILSISRSL